MVYIPEVDGCLSARDHYVWWMTVSAYPAHKVIVLPQMASANRQVVILAHHIQCIKLDPDPVPRLSL